MRRSKFPYTAKSSARVIRHAVSIDERRAKFRQDLISEGKPSELNKEHGKQTHDEKTGLKQDGLTNGSTPSHANAGRFRRRSQYRSTASISKAASPRLSTVDEGHLDPQQSSQNRFRSPSPINLRIDPSDGASVTSGASVDSYQPGQHPDDDDDDEDQPQDVEELWYSGCHADIGGGWPLADGEDSALSHGPLVWIVREAQSAGLEFDRERLLQFKCCDENYDIPSSTLASNGSSLPQIQVSQPFTSPRSEHQEPGCMSKIISCSLDLYSLDLCFLDLDRYSCYLPSRSNADMKPCVGAAGMDPEIARKTAFQQTLFDSATKGRLHDCLAFNNGLSVMSVISWNIMEYLPFRRMDLRPDGSWKAITFPLPRGEVRDIPEGARIHHSAIQRMEADEKYRYVYILEKSENPPHPSLENSNVQNTFRGYQTHKRPKEKKKNTDLPKPVLVI